MLTGPGTGSRALRASRCGCSRKVLMMGLGLVALDLSKVNLYYLAKDANSQIKGVFRSLEAVHAECQAGMREEPDRLLPRRR